MQGALLALLVLWTGSVAAVDAALSMEVPAGQTKHIRLRNLPAGAQLAISIVSSGRVLVTLIGGKQAKATEGAPKPVFRAALERKLAFKVTIPEADDYYLVFNNRKGTAALTVDTEIRAARGRTKPRPAPQPYSPRPEKASISPSFSSAASSARRARECAASARRWAIQ